MNSVRDNLRPIVPEWSKNKTALLWWRGTYSTAQIYDAAVVGIIDSTTTQSNLMSYVDADTTNTFMADGTSLIHTGPDATTGATDNKWHIKTGVGNNSSVLSSSELGGENAPVIKTQVNISSAGSYDVWVNFWGTPASDWRIKAGLSANSMQLFRSMACKMVDSSSHNVSLLQSGDGNYLYQAYLGRVQVPSNGSFNVFVDDSAIKVGTSGSTLTGNTNRTWYDGVSYALVNQSGTLPLSPDAVNLLSPINASTDIILPVKLKWFSSSRASSYWLQLSTDSTFTTVFSGNSGITDTTFTVNGLNNLTTYYWRVSAVNINGTGPWSKVWSFKTIIDTPGTAMLLAPNNSSTIIDTATSILFSWKSASFASTYEFQISSNNNFSTIIADTAGIKDTVYIYHPKNLTATFYWRVRGNNIAGTGSWSSVNSVSIISGIDKLKSGVPLAYALYQNYPNPFNPSTVMRFALPFSSTVKIEIYNILGEKIREIVNEQRGAGYYELNFNSSGLASGVYLYLLQATSTDGKTNFRDTKKMVLLK